MSVDYGVHQPDTAHFSETHGQKVGRLLGLTSRVLSAEVKDIVNFLDVDIMDGNAVAQGHQVDGVILVGSIVDPRLVFVIVEVGKVKQDMIPRLEEELEILVEVEVESLLGVGG